MTSTVATRTSILTAPVFVCALAMLGINDWVLKAQFSNFLTGKLSDFAGLFAFVCFCIAVLPAPRLWIATAIAGMFIWWKLPMSDNTIGGWNSLGSLPIGRTVDPTDLFALVMIPAACAYIARVRSRPSSFRVRAPVSIIAILLFAGTSYITIVPYTTEYQIPVPYARFGELLDSARLDYVSHSRDDPRFSDSGSIRVPTSYCPSGVWASIRVVENAADVSKVFLVEMHHRCTGKSGDSAVLLRLFQDSVVMRLQGAARRLQTP